MLGSLQITSIWLALGMLLVQVFSPALRAGCGCERPIPPDTTAQACCCCVEAEPAAEAANECPHCEESSEQEVEPPVCHCDEQAPTLPAAPPVPTSISWVALLELPASEIISPASAPPAVASSQLPSSEVSIPHFKQVFCCVWLH